MTSPATVTIRCPYCGHQNIVTDVHVSAQLGGPFTVLCFSEDGGCDQYFVATVRWVAVIEVLGIEGNTGKDHKECTCEPHALANKDCEPFIISGPGETFLTVCVNRKMTRGDVAKWFCGTEGKDWIYDCCVECAYFTERVHVILRPDKGWEDTLS